MTDAEITALCAAAVGRTDDAYDPLHSEAQAFELIERLRLSVTPSGSGWWADAGVYPPIVVRIHGAPPVGLLRAVCTCAAMLQAARST